MSDLKDSGSYWLGEIPEHWEMLPAWALFTEGKEKCGPDDPHLVPSRVYGVVTRDDLTELSGNKPVDNEASAHNMKHVNPHDFIISMGSHESGIEHSRLVGKVSNDYRVLRPTNDVNPEYYKWFFKSAPLIEGLRGLTTEIRVGQRIHYSRFSLLRLPIPSAADQQRIADYLDRETAEIDAAVADLDKYIELLEKRKLSKIESALNAISYQMCPVGLLADVTLGKMVSTTPPKAGGLERQYLRAAHVQPGGRLDFTVAEKKMWFSEKELERLDLLTGDVVVVEGGAGFGRSAYLESDLEGWGFQNSINRVRVDSSKADGRFVYLMLSRALLNGSIGISVDTATLPHFTAEKLARFRIPTCEIHKQKQLSHEVHKDILTANNLIAESMKLRNLLLKRRSVLITEVVTGRKQV